MNSKNSPEYVQKQDMKALAINLVADLLVEYKGDQLRNIVRNINL